MSSRPLTFKAKHIEDFQKEQQDPLSGQKDSVAADELPGGLIKKPSQSAEKVRKRIV